MSSDVTITLEPLSFGQLLWLLLMLTVCSFRWQKLFNCCQKICYLFDVSGLWQSVVQTGIGVSERLSIQSTDGKVRDSVLSP